MTLRIDRRSLILGGSFGLGALTLAGGANAARIFTARGFTHNVASGEPGPKSVLLWTRYVPANGDDARLTVEVSDTPGFARITAGGIATASRIDDFTARVTVDGLDPGRWYFYRFIAADGSRSPTGRTRTLPVGNVDRFGLGVFSCSNLPFGWFNAYAHAAQRQDLDLIVHTGDYLYEYARGTYPGAEQAMAMRLIEPAGEMIQLADYRLRHASYRADADLQRLHQMFPMIAQWDDHEIANDAWKDGAQNHQPSEGDYVVRKQAAVKAYNEWMPVSGGMWSSYDVGDLATIFRPETRITGRAVPLDLDDALKGDGAIEEKLRAFRDGVLADPARSLMGTEQEAWLAAGLAQSVKRGAKWQVVAQQINVGQVITPADAMNLVPADAPDYVRAEIRSGIAAAKLGIQGYFDNWGGFPAARSRFLKAAQAADADLVVLAGDSHNAWAFEFGEDGKPAGVEFGGHSVTSPGYETYLTGATPDAVARSLVASSPELKWADTSNRGYMAIALTPERVTGEWVMLEGIRTRSTATRASHLMAVERGRRVFSAG